MKKFKIRLIADDEVKELIAVANNLSEIQKLLKNRYNLDNYTAITIFTKAAARFVRLLYF